MLRKKACCLRFCGDVQHVHRTVHLTQLKCYFGSTHVTKPLEYLRSMQVYAYTTSELQVAILRLFVRAECRLPNLFVGTLTRESVTQALDFGVQADQIISFMQQHAHPHVLHKVPIVPEVSLRCHRHLHGMHSCFLCIRCSNCLLGNLYAISTLLLVGVMP